MSAAVSSALYLDPIPPVLQSRAIEAYEQGDALRFLCYASNEAWLALVCDNREAFRERGIYEAALLHAFTGTRTNNSGWSQSVLDFLFYIADKAKLRAAGQPLPGPGPFTLYRGVSGTGRARRVRGYSWTDSIDVAWWFADRYSSLGLSDPAVFTATVEARDVLAFTDETCTDDAATVLSGAGRSEREFIVQLPRSARPRRVKREVQS